MSLLAAHHGAIFQCPLCDRKLEVAQVRQIQHVGICEHHGVVQAHCPGSSGHITRPAPAQPAIEPTPAQSKIAALGVLVGFILGVTIGVFLVAPAILRSLS